MVTLVARDLDFAASGVGAGMGPLRIMDDAAADGTFEITGVPPGSFTSHRADPTESLRALRHSDQRFTAPPHQAGLSKRERCRSPWTATSARAQHRGHRARWDGRP